jgi:hypothetical protein
LPLQLSRRQSYNSCRIDTGAPKHTNLRLSMIMAMVDIGHMGMTMDQRKVAM